MSDSHRSFWSSIPGLVTGLAGLLTGVVGLITLLVQLDVIGDGGSDQPATSTTVAVGVATTAPAGVTTTEPAAFTLGAARVDFPPTDPKQKLVTVRNTGRTDLRLSQPTVTGRDADRFAWAFGDCAAALRPNAVCNLQVTFVPSGPLRSYAATLQVLAPGAQARQVELTATTLL